MQVRLNDGEHITVTANFVDNSRSFTIGRHGDWLQCREFGSLITAQPQENKERAENSPASPLQQLKAEIASFREEALTEVTKPNADRALILGKLIQQLSAV